MKYFLTLCALVFSSNVFASTYEFICISNEITEGPKGVFDLKKTFTYQVEQNSDIIQRHYVAATKRHDSDDDYEAYYEEPEQPLPALWTADKLTVSFVNKGQGYNFKVKEIINRNDLSLTILSNGFLDLKTQCSMKDIDAKKLF